MILLIILVNLKKIMTVFIKYNYKGKKPYFFSNRETKIHFNLQIEKLIQMDFRKYSTILTTIMVYDVFLTTILNIAIKATWED